MTTTTITTQQRLTIVKHLAGGKDLDVVAALTRLDRSTVLDIASHHGYPSTELLGRAVRLLEAKLERDEAPTEHPNAREIAAQEAARRPNLASSPTASRVGRALTTGSAEPLTKPDEIRVLLNTSKDHPSKRVQGAGERVLAAVERLRDLIREDEEKHAEKRRQEQQRIAAKAEVDRLTQALADAKAKLKGSKPKPTTLDVDDSVTSAQLRQWARDNGVDVPAVGRVPAEVRAAYTEAHQEEAKAG